VDHPAALINRAAQAGEQVGVRDETRTHEHRRAGDDCAVAQLHALQLVVADHQPRDRAFDDADATGGQVLALRWREGVRVWEQGDVGRPLPYQQRVLDSLRPTPKHSERLVPDLVAMAVGAVQQVPSPSLPDAGNVSTWGPFGKLL
jgi:hypothetical protein